MEENALSEMSFQGVDRYCSSVGTGDSALEHRRWLEFGLGTNAKRFAPIRQGEGVSRIISGDSKGQRVLWRVFLHTLSSRKERVCPRRALTFEKRFVSLGVVTGFAYQINARNNPSGVLADTTSLYTREALVPSSSERAGEDGRCGAGTPPALCATSPYRGGKRFPLKGGMSRSDKGVQQGRAKASDDSQ